MNEFYTQEKTRAKTREKYTYYNPKCKECVKQNYDEWRLKNPEKHRESNRRYVHSEKGLKTKREINRKVRKKGIYRLWQRNNSDKVKKYNENRKHKNHDITNEEWESCKDYFDYKCAYCGISENEAKEQQGNYFHKEHVDHNGSNNLSNCVPACRICNSSKHTFNLEEWYNDRNENYTEERNSKIIKWLNEDYKN